jgi:hypothetical protein
MTLNQVTNLLLLLIVTSLFLPATAIMYASGSPENNGESDSGSTDDDDASDDGSMEMDDESDSGSMEMDDESDTWSMEKSNNALDSGSMEMDDASDDGSMEMDDESDTWSMEKSNNALNPEPAGGGTIDGLSPLTSGPAGSTNDGLSPLTSGPTGGTNDGLSPLTSGFRIEGNNTGSAPASTAYNATFTRVPENKKNTNNETAANFANNILAVQNQERAKVGVPPLTWSDKLAADAKTWADYMAATHDFRHDSEHLGNLGEGENLAGALFFWSDPPSTAKLQAGWVNEKNNSQAVATGDAVGAGHYLQLTSRTAKEVGCATGFTSGPSPDMRWVYLVCRFSPPGWDSWVMNQFKPG